MKKPAIIALIATLILAVLAGGYLLISKKSKSQSSSQTTSKKQIINALPFSERPFTVLVPHSTNKLITLLVDKKPTTDITIDIEYLSGNALKGGRTTILGTTASPYTQGFLLGSCSAGGKCSFDTDITTGNIKTKIDSGNEINLLKSNYAFVDKDTSTSDQKLKFSPTGKSTAQLILAQTHGYDGTLEQEVAAEPVAITSTKDDLVTGTLTIFAPDATKAVIYDGTSYQPLDSKKVGENLVIELKQKPWSKKVTIVRDDQQEKEEEVTLYIVGSIVPVK